MWLPTVVGAMCRTWRRLLLAGVVVDWPQVTHAYDLVTAKMISCQRTWLRHLHCGQFRSWAWVLSVERLTSSLAIAHNGYAFCVMSIVDVGLWLQPSFVVMFPYPLGVWLKYLGSLVRVDIIRECHFPPWRHRSRRPTPSQFSLLILCSAHVHGDVRLLAVISEVHQCCVFYGGIFVIISS